MKKLIFILAIVIVVIIIISLPGPATQIDYESLKTPQAPAITGVMTKSFIDETDSYIIAVHIPQTGKTNLDTLLNATAHRAIGSFKQDLAKVSAATASGNKNPYVLHIDYNIYHHSANLWSIVFDKEIFWEDDLWHRELATINYDISGGKELGIRDMFKPNTAAINNLYKYSTEKMQANIGARGNYDITLFNKGISPDIANYDLFAMTQDGLIIFFDYGQLTADENDYYSLIIPYGAIFGMCLTEEGLPRAIDPNKPMIALTFDDGPHSKYTPVLLDALKKRGAKVTFFVLGNRAEGLPAIIKRAVEEGHSVNIHSYNHIGSFTNMSQYALDSHLSRTAGAIKAASGKAPNLVRPPYGAINKEVAAKINYPIILWNVDTLDWKYRDANYVAKYIINHAQDGDIILLHDIHGTSVTGAVSAIDTLQARGYQFVTVEELFYHKNKSLNNGGIYRSVK